MADAPDALKARSDGTNSPRRGRRRTSPPPEAESTPTSATRRRRTGASDSGRRHRRKTGERGEANEAEAQVATTEAPTEKKSQSRSRKPAENAADPEAKTETPPKKPTRRGSRGGRKRSAAKAAKAASAAAAQAGTETAAVETPAARIETKAPTSTKPRARSRRAPKPKLPEPDHAYDDSAPVQSTLAPPRSRVPVTGAPTAEVPAPFAHNAEYEFARLLDFYGVEWVYEPRSFPLRWERGHVTEAFTPDFYLPDLDLFIELTTLKSNLTAEKNRKMREIKELYPDTKIMMLKKRDYLRLLANYGYGSLTSTQVPELDRVMIPQAKLQQRVQELGEQISRDYADKEPVLVGVLRGVLVFMADLMRQITVPTSVDLMAISSYDGNGAGAAAVRIQKDLDLNIKGRDVILVEDIVDTGMTLNHVIDYLQTKRPASVKVCTLLNKPARRMMDVPLDYVGFEIEDEFVVGYGLDFHQRFRNLPYIGTLKHDLLP
jgi:hypoxanthine phosphoribosyltransferase